MLAANASGARLADKLPSRSSIGAVGPAALLLVEAAAISAQPGSMEPPFPSPQKQSYVFVPPPSIG